MRKIYLQEIQKLLSFLQAEKYETMTAMTGEKQVPVIVSVLIDKLLAPILQECKVRNRIQKNDREIPQGKRAVASKENKNIL